MTIGVVPKGSIGSTGGTATYGAVSTVSLASGGAVGDLELEAVAWDQILGTTVTAGGDWQTVTVQSAGAVFWRTRTAGSSDTLPLTFTGNSGSVGFHASGVRYRGVSGGLNGLSVGVGAIASSLTASVAGIAVALFAFQITSVGTAAALPGSPWTSDGIASDTSSTTSGLVYGVGIAEKTITTAESTGTATLSWDGSGLSGIAVTVMVEQNHPPTQPTWLASDGEALNLAAAQALPYRFNTPDTGVEQATRTWRYSSNGGTSWTTGGTNQPVDGSTILGEIDIAANTFTAGNYQFQIELTDSNGLTSPWSPSLHVTFGAAPATPSISSPTSGTTLGSSSQSFAVTCSDPYTAFRYSAVDSAGRTIAALTTGSGSSFTLAGMQNDTSVTVTVAVQGSDGVWSADYTAVYPVAYTPPPTPVVSLVATPPDPEGDLAASLTCAWAVTDPGDGSRAAATSVLVEYARTTSTGTVERSLTTTTLNGTDVYPIPALNTDYSVRVTAVAATGATATSGWVS